ncbi:glycine zipper 2TM domain-containing protein [Nitrosophilus alvini]|uniref:glycine zipper 2TM domain-containing protein n=1 Tax=Nitrosophilus alvini TaxID=2714855 RepID=UPI00190ABAA6|nr:glycine zipper 2TM domain-containing protein [Nitrosophilus alvini]
MKKLIFAVLAIVATNMFAQSFSYIEYVEVTRSEPVYRTVVKRIPYQECWDEEVPVAYENRYSDNSDTVGALIGGVAGGIIGNQVGRGSGKTAATVGGAIIGTLVGKNLASRNNSYVTTGYKTVRRCRTRYEEREERVQKGYRNYAFYNGREIVKFSRRPLRNIKVKVTVTY